MATVAQLVRLGIRRGGNGAPVEGPVFTEPPQISGALLVGETLSCDGGTVTGDGVEKSYQWSLDGVPVDGQVGPTFVLPIGAQNASPACEVTATNLAGSAQASASAARVAMQFGAKTRSGAGGFLTASSSGSTDSADWVVDADGFIAATGTYGAYKAFGSTSYSLTLPDETASSIALIEGKAHVRALSTDASGGSQLRTILGLTSGSNGALTLGDEVICRDSHQNPTGANDFMGAPTGLWSAGSGERVTVRSENPASGVDDHGHRVRGGGYKLGKFYFGGPASTEYPLDFRNISFLVNVATPATSNLGQYQNGYGVRFIECDFRYGPDVTPPGGAGMNVGGRTSFEDCHFENLKSYAINGGEAGNFTITGCVFRGMLGDAIDVNGGGHSITHNFIYEFRREEGAHCDACQLGTPTTNVTSWGEFAYNGVARGPIEEVIESAQGLFGGDKDGLATIAGMSVHNNLFALDSQAVIRLNAIADSEIAYNTLISDPCSPWTIVAASVFAGWYDGGDPVTAAGWTNVDVHHNIANAYELTLTTGGEVSDNVTVAFNNGTINTSGPRADYLAALTVMFPNMWQTEADAPKNMRELTLALTPADLDEASGGAKLADGTFAGALFPPNPGEQWGSWNDGSVYAPTDPEWVTAHPPVYS